MQLRRSRGERFFLVMGLVLLACVIAGFVPPALARPGGIASMPLLLHVHGAVFVSWFVLFCAQAHLIGTNSIRLHQSLGKASIGIAVGMIVLGYVVMRGANADPNFSIAGMSPAASLMFPFTDIVNFVIAYGLALTFRRSPATHKRFMLLAGILIIDPAAARLVITLGLSVQVVVIMELAMYVALIVYDVVTRRRPHWASLLGLGLFVIALGAKLTVSQHSGWASFVEVVFG
jgi:hypothetical protein